MPTHVSVSEAKAQLTELVRRAEAGEDIVLTRHGRQAVRLVPANAAIDRSRRAILVDAIVLRARTKATDGPSAARSQDHLYGDDGLPG
jgi:prevent-host-death family protein